MLAADLELAVSMARGEGVRGQPGPDSSGVAGGDRTVVSAQRSAQRGRGPAHVWQVRLAKASSTGFERPLGRAALVGVAGTGACWGA